MDDGSIEPARPDAAAAPTIDALRDAAAWLAGHYSSAAQAAEDATYFDVRLHIVPIWPDRVDGPWFYVEQAMA
ncbi:MAG: CpcT/CpeT family chromophore lyase, partial [Phycisphaerales bacterium]